MVSFEIESVKLNGLSVDWVVLSSAYNVYMV
jgi:hypothetical protein